MSADLIAIDTHTHLEMSCRSPFDSYGEEYDRAADKYFRSSKRPTMQETIDFYRAMKIGFVDFTVDAETQLGRRRIPNEEIAEAAQAYSLTSFLASRDRQDGLADLRGDRRASAAGDLPQRAFGHRLGHALRRRPAPAELESDAARRRGHRLSRHADRQPRSDAGKV